MDYTRAIDLYELLNKGNSFLKPDDTKLINFVKTFLYEPSKIDKPFIVKFKKLLESEYKYFKLAQQVKLVDSVYVPTITDYLVRVFFYDSRFPNDYLMNGEQMITISISNDGLGDIVNVTINSTFIDLEVIHSSVEDIKQRSMDFIKADINGEVIYLDELDDGDYDIM